MIQTTLTQTTNTHFRADTCLLEDFDYVQRHVIGRDTDKFVIQFPGNYRFDDNTSTRLSSFLLGLSSRTDEHWINAVCLLEDPHATLQVPSWSGHFYFAPQNPSQLYRTVRVFDPGLAADPALDPLDISLQLARLKSLKDGWADGIQPAAQWGEEYGRAPSSQALDWLAGQLAAHYAIDVPRPYIYPIPEGGVSLEWFLGPYRASLEIDFDTCQAEWHCLDLSTDVSYEQDLQLDIPQSWKWLASEVRRLGDPAA